MRNDQTIINILISSPNDVKVEREICVKTINEINGLLSNSLGITYLVHTSNRIAPAVTHKNGGVQDMINAAIPMDKIDIYIGIVWSRLGTPTKNWQSGTEEEFEIAYHMWQKNATPTIMVYHNVSAPREDANSDQIEKLNKFINEFSLGGSHPGFVQEYDKYDDFEQLIKKNLLDYVVEKYNQLQKKNNENSLSTNFRLEKRGINKFFVPKEKRNQRTEDKNKSMNGSKNIKLMAHAGFSYLALYVNRMYPQVKTCLDNGSTVKIILTNPYSQSGYFISVADEGRVPQNGEDIIKFIEDASWIKYKQNVAIVGYKNLKEIYGDLIQVRMLGFDISSTILLTDNIGFIEPYAFCKMGEKDMSTFEIEFSKDSYLYNNLNEYFNTLWSYAESYEEYENKIEIYKKLLETNWMFY